MYTKDVGTATMSGPYRRSGSFPLVTPGAPEEIRAPNFLIRSCSKLCSRTFSTRKLAGRGGLANVPVSPRTFMNESQTKALRGRQVVAVSRCHEPNFWLNSREMVARFSAHSGVALRINHPPGRSPEKGCPSRTKICYSKGLSLRSFEPKA